MPELPEVEAIRRHLAPALTGVRIDRVVVRRRDVVRDHLGRRRGRLDPEALGVGRRIDRVGRRGKQLVLHLEGGGAVVLRLGMSGRVDLRPRGAGSTSRHRHVVWMLDADASGSRRRLDFVDPRRFGGVHLAQSPEDLRGRLLGDLGPEAHEVASDVLHERLGRTSRAVKIALLDQSVLAGVGNIYADEALFRAGIHPMQPGRTLRRQHVRRLAEALASILRIAIENGGSTIQSHTLPDGNDGAFTRHHKVYGRSGEPCTRCGKHLDRSVLGGRSTTFCAGCQPLRPHAEG